MANPNFAGTIADALDKITTLEDYGHDDLTVGWWRGQAYVKMWNFRTGASHWRPFVTTRTPQPPPHHNPFATEWLFQTMKRKQR